jgi:hypothetical protein
VHPAGQCLDVQWLGVLPIHPIPDAPQQREIAQTLDVGRSIGHAPDRATTLQAQRPSAG